MMGIIHPMKGMKMKSKGNVNKLFLITIPAGGRCHVRYNITARNAHQAIRRAFCDVFTNVEDVAVMPNGGVMSRISGDGEHNFTVLALPVL